MSHPPIFHRLHVVCYTRILGVFPLDYIIDVVAPRSEDPKLIIRVITSN